MRPVTASAGRSAGSAPSSTQRRPAGGEQATARPSNQPQGQQDGGESRVEPGRRVNAVQLAVLDNRLVLGFEQEAEELAVGLAVFKRLVRRASRPGQVVDQAARRLCGYGQQLVDPDVFRAKPVGAGLGNAAQQRKEARAVVVQYRGQEVAGQGAQGRQSCRGLREASARGPANSSSEGEDVRELGVSAVERASALESCSSGQAVEQELEDGERFGAVGGLARYVLLALHARELAVQGDAGDSSVLQGDGACRSGVQSAQGGQLHVEEVVRSVRLRALRRGEARQLDVQNCRVVNDAGQLAKRGLVDGLHSDGQYQVLGVVGGAEGDDHVSFVRCLAKQAAQVDVLSDLAQGAAAAVSVRVSA